MSLNPSNLIAAANNPGRRMFPNLACRSEDKAQWERVDAQVLAELNEAGIQVEGPCESIRSHREVPSAYLGSLCLWGFRRAWYYWVATGPGIPPERAEMLHRAYGKECRVDGQCGCPSPLEHNHGFAVGQYHIDTQEGLNAFATMLKGIYVE
jgi:hypothetical protein